MKHYWEDAVVQAWREQEKKGGLSLSPLPKGTKLIVETRNSFYELVIDEGKEVTLFGGTNKDGSTRFPQPIKGIVYGSTWGGSLLKVDWIGQDMRLEMHIKGTDRVLSTSPVKNVTVEAPDGSWSYSLDWNK